MDRKDDPPVPTQSGTNPSASNEIDSKTSHSKVNQAWRSLSYASVGLEMAVATLVGWWFGYYLDGRFGTYPILMLVFLVLGSAAGFKGLIRATKQAKREATESN